MSRRRYAVNLLALFLLYAASIGAIALYGRLVTDYFTSLSLFAMNTALPFVLVPTVGAAVICPVLAGFRKQAWIRVSVFAFLFVYSALVLLVQSVFVGFIGGFAVFVAPFIALVPAVLMPVLVGLLKNGRQHA